MNRLATKANKLSFDIAKYLDGVISKERKFPARSFYGESFCLNLLYRHELNNLQNEEVLLNEYFKKDKGDPEFHFEFNNYAFLDLYELSNKYDFWKIIYPFKFKNTPVTNWTLLRANTKIRANIDLQNSWAEINSKINNYQLNSGLILDDVGVKSFQYHCFSAAMLIEIYEHTLKEYVFISFEKAVSFIRKFILENGEALYIGRGQEQSFGLGVLVYILAKYYEHSNDDTVLNEIDSILNFLESFQYQNGAFPLVFNGKEPRDPFKLEMLSEDYLGWYPYNNYFDYLPFLGFFLKKASDCLSRFSFETTSKEDKDNFSNSSFLVNRMNTYNAICSAPGGYWTNDLSFPLIQYKNKWITPMLGGEQFQQSLYQLNALSLPYTKFLNLSWRKFGRAIFINNSLCFFSLFGLQIRTYVFEENVITVKYRSLVWMPSFNLLSLLESNYKEESPCVGPGFKMNQFKHDLIENGYSTSGKLKILKFKMNITIKMELE